jgi:hypothetical protein
MLNIKRKAQFFIAAIAKITAFLLSLFISTYSMLVGLVGVASITYGVSLISVPGAYIACGVLLIVHSWFAAKAIASAKAQRGNK